jgi:hypothetical protein
MRQRRVVKLEEGDAIVHELTVGEVRNLIQAMNEGGKLEKWKTISLEQIFNHLEEFLHLTNCLQLPTGLSVYDLSVSESAEIITAWKEIHASFFPLITSMGLSIMKHLPSSQKTASP